MKQVQATKMEGWTSSAKQKLPQSSYRGSQASRLKKLEDFEYNRISHHKTCALWRSWWFTNIRIGVALPCPAMPCHALPIPGKILVNHDEPRKWASKSCRSTFRISNWHILFQHILGSLRTGKPPRKTNGWYPKKMQRMLVAKTNSPCFS